MKKLFLLFLFITQITFGQSNIVEINTTGSGETKEEAVQNALLSALKQSFGVFISSNTEIINDVLTKDKISELSSGNILEYNIISETQNGNYFNTLVSSKISMNTLVSYTKNKVDSNEISGDVFVSNFLIKELNKENELQSIKDLIEYSKKILPNSMDYSILAGEPISTETLQIENDIFDFLIYTVIKFKKNNNYDIWNEFFKKVMNNIALGYKEYYEFQKQGIQLFPLIINNKFLFLRNFDSYLILDKFFKQVSLNNKYNFNISFDGIGKSYDILDYVEKLNFPEDFKYLETRVPRTSKFSKNSILDLLTIDNLDSLTIEPEYMVSLPLIHRTLNYSSREPTVLSPVRDFINDFNDLYKKEKFPFIDIDHFKEREQSVKKLYLSSEYYQSLPSWWRKSKYNPSYPAKPKGIKRKDWSKYVEKKIDHFLYQKLLSELPVRDGGKSCCYTKSPLYNVLAIQSDFETKGIHVFISLFNLNDLKKFRGFQITNSN
jgi:hypothetical protein